MLNIRVEKTTAPKAKPADSHLGTNGINPKRGMVAQRFRIVELGEGGEPTGYSDEGTAGELANRNDISPATIYKRAGREPSKYSKWRVEKVG